MNQRERNDLDRHITGNYGEDQLLEESGMCIWDDCDKDAIYCEGHAREYMLPDIDALRSRNKELVEALCNLLDVAKRANIEVPMSDAPVFFAARALIAKAQP